MIICLKATQQPVVYHYLHPFMELMEYNNLQETVEQIMGNIGKHNNSHNYKMPSLSQYIYAIGNPIKSLSQLNHLRPYIKPDGTLEYWFDENRVVFHMIDSMNDNETGLECFLDKKYMESQITMNNGYDGEPNFTLFLSEITIQNNKYPVLWHHKYNQGKKRIVKNHLKHPDSNKTADTFVISKDKKTLYRWNQACGIRGNHSCSHLYIPKGINTIAEGAFAGCEEIEYISFPDSVKKIGRGAFAGCGSIRIHFTSLSLEVIEDYAFYNCKIYLQGEMIKSVNNAAKNAFFKTTISHNSNQYEISLVPTSGNSERKNIQLSPISTQHIRYDHPVLEEGSFDDGNGVIYDATSKYLIKCVNRDLKRYKVNETAIEILPGAFSGMNELIEIDISNVEIIGSFAFKGCRSLRKIYGFDNIQSLGEYSFAGTGLKQITLSEKIISIGAGAFQDCQRLQSVEYHCSVDKLSASLFSDCKNLEKVRISNDVFIIGTEAFRNCVKLCDINIPTSCIVIERLAFGNCHSLSQILLSPNIIELGELAFCNCSIHSITIPRSMLLMDYSPFSGCREITINSDSPLFSSNGQFLMGYNESRLISYLKDECNVVIPNTVKVILGYSLTNRRDHAKFYIPDSVEFIGHWAFRYVRGTQINIPKSVKFIHSNYGYCSSIDIFYISKTFFEQFPQKDSVVYD